MLFLKRFRAPKPTFSSRLAPDEPFFAIGDIHGRDDLLSRLLDRMAEIAPDIRLVFVGDYVDRGEESPNVLRRLQALQVNNPQTVCLIGNHEQMLLQFLDSPARTGPRWLRYGGLQTMAGYAVAPVAETASEAKWNDARDRLRSALGPHTEEWLRNLPTLWQSGNVAVLHAGADPAQPLADQDDNTLIWGHPDFDTKLRSDGQWVVHGHTIVDEASPKAGRISIDTGAYATGRLTAALIRSGSVKFFTA